LVSRQTRLVFAPHAIDNSRFGEDRTEEATALRRSLNIKESERVVLFAGKLESVKTPARLLEAFLKVSEPGSHLLFVGNGHLEAKLKARASGNARVHFLPFQNQRSMPVMYAACDLFCLPSKSETWGLAVNEAMAAGKAVLVSDRVGCAEDLVKKGVNGNVFSSDDPNSLEQALKALLFSKKRLEEMGEASKAIISQWTFLEQVKGFELAMGYRSIPVREKV
jgi:glycosyltransferase involved in cell wall biosynthesis